jgi:hypothetical protein
LTTATTGASAAILAAHQDAQLLLTFFDKLVDFRNLRPVLTRATSATTTAIVAATLAAATFVAAIAAAGITTAAPWAAAIACHASKIPFKTATAARVV